MGVSSVQRSGQAPRATEISAALNRSMASRPLAMAAADWSNSLRRVIGGGRWDFERRGWAAAGGLGERLVDRQRQGEGRMRGEDGGEAGAFGERLVFGPADRAVVGVGAQQMLRQAGQDAVIGRGVDAAEIGRRCGRRGR